MTLSESDFDFLTREADHQLSTAANEIIARLIASARSAHSAGVGREDVRSAVIAAMEEYAQHGVQALPFGQRVARKGIILNEAVSAILALQPPTIPVGNGSAQAKTDSPSDGNGWQGIDSAPRDGISVLVWDGKNLGQLSIYPQSEPEKGGWTHWRPLPPPPNGDETDSRLSDDDGRGS